MKSRIFISVIILATILCAVGCSKERNIEITTGYIYNLSDKSTRTFTEPYSIRYIEWSPNSNYFSYANWESKVKRNVKIRKASDLEVVEGLFDDKKNKGDSVINEYWNKESNLVVSIKNKGDYCFNPDTKSLETATETDKETYSVSKLSEDEIKKCKKEFGIPDNEVLFSDKSKTRFYYFTSDNEVVCCNIKSGEREVTLQTMQRPQWTEKGNKIIYKIPKAGFESIEKQDVYQSNLFETYIYDFETKEKTKIADFYAQSYYCSPDEKYLILIPDNYDNDCRM